MYDLMQSIKRVLDPQEKVTVLAGAGVSKSSPSHLPTGIDFINAFYDFLGASCPDAYFESRIEVLKQHKSLRFENIMSLIQGNSPKGVNSLLDCYKECHCFNVNHGLLATLGKAGHTVMTTNFDSLIERASTAPKAIVYDREYETSGREGVVYKLHGSLEIYEEASGTWRDSSDSVRLTLEQVGQQGYELKASLQKKKFLSERLRTSHLIVVGYSGYDDFDIVPIMLNVRSDRNILWLNYHAEDVCVFAGEQILQTPERFGKSGEVLHALMAKGVRGKDACFIAQADASTFLAAVADVLACGDTTRPEKTEGYAVNPGAYFAERLGKVLCSEELVRIMKGALLQVIGDHEHAVTMHQQVLDVATRKNDLYVKSKALYEIATCYLNMNPPRYEEALRYAKASYDIDQSCQFHWLFLSVDLLARIYGHLGEFDRMRRIYETLVRMPMAHPDQHFMNRQLATIYHNYSVALAKDGKTARALELARKARSVLEKVGDLSGYTSSAVGLAAVLMESGSVDESLEHLREVEEIATRLDDFDGLCRVKNEMGIALKYKGDFHGAIRCHREAAEFAEIVGSRLELARQYYNIACCEMRLGDVKAAWKANMQSFDIRNALPESEETWSGVSENYQLMGRAFGILRNYEQAKKCFGASNELARKAHYAQIICDNCCNLLALSMQMDMADEVESLTKELKHLLTEENQMSGRWKQMKIAIDLYWQMRAARNASDGELSK